MKAVILAGGYGTRISEESQFKPKPMVDIGGMPILWHIMKIYSAHNINEFIICLGYKGYIIKEYFANYFIHMSDVTFDFEAEDVEIHHKKAEPWKVTLVDTGEDTMTGGRIRRIAEYVNGTEFCMTYGDGVGNIDITALLKQHRKRGTIATVTAALPPGRFGALKLNGNDKVEAIHEKPRGDGSWINAGFFVLSPDVFRYIEGDEVSFEEGPLPKLAADGQLSAYLHKGFWQPMDSLRDKRILEKLWLSGQAPWKIWQ